MKRGEEIELAILSQLEAYGSLNLKDLSGELGVHPATVYGALTRLLKRGSIVARKIGPPSASEVDARADGQWRLKGLISRDFVAPKRSARRTRYLLAD